MLRKTTFALVLLCLRLAAQTVTINGVPGQTVTGLTGALVNPQPAHTFAGPGTFNYVHNLNTLTPVVTCWSSSPAAQWSALPVDVNTTAVTVTAASTVTCAFNNGDGTSVFTPTVWNASEEFIPGFSLSFCGMGQLGWCPSGAGAIGQVAGYNGHPGTMRILTTTSNPETDTLGLNNNNTGPNYSFYLGSTAQVATWETRFTVQTDDWSGNVTNVQYEMGWKDSQTYRSGNSIAVRYDSNSNSCTSGTNSTTAWMLEVFTSGSSTCIATSVAVAASTWYTFILKSTTLGTVTLQVSTNGGAPTTAVSVATNVPTAQLAPMFLVKNTAAFRYALIIDWWQTNMTGLTR